MLLVHADEAEAAHRREDRRARADDDARLPGRDAFALVAPLRLGELAVQDGDAVAEARPEAAQRLRCERDLGDEHDRAQPALQRCRADLEVDLGLAAARGAVEEEAAAAARVELRHEPVDGSALRRGQPRGSASPESASRATGARRSPRRRRTGGATSASARPGVEP